MAGNPFGFDAKTWERVKNMNHSQIKEAVPILQELATAHSNALNSMQQLAKAWAEFPQYATYQSFVVGEAANPKVAMIIETWAIEQDRVVDIERTALAKGLISEDERLRFPAIA